jgi:hypothetical protein
VRGEKFDQAMAKAIFGRRNAAVSNSDLAKFLGLATSTASRLRTGAQGAGWGTIHKVRTRMPEISLNDIFESDRDLDAEFPRRDPQPQAA